MIECFNAMEVIPGLYADGEKTLGENIADLGGVLVAHQAFMTKKKAEGFSRQGLVDEEAKFFLSYPQLWKSIYTDAYAVARVKNDVHSINKLRINGILNHVDAWYDRFDVQWGDLNYLSEEKRARIW